MENKYFIKYLNAICNNNKGKCNICMMGDYFKEPSLYCPLRDSTLMRLLEAAREDENDIFKKEETIRNLLSEVKQYSLTNPIRTRQEIFLEKYPKTMINMVDGCIDIKREMILSKRKKNVTYLYVRNVEEIIGARKLKNN